MRKIRLLLGMAITLVVLLAMSLALNAQQQSSPGYHTVACFKLKPDSSDAFHKYVNDEVLKIAQARVESGDLSAWYLLHSVFPQGESAECDYIIVAIYPKMPHLLTKEIVAAAIKRAGLTITADDYLKHRDAVSRLISSAIYQNQTSVGGPQKGDFFEVSYMKASQDNIEDWIDYEKKVWKPFAEQSVKDGVQHGWSVNVPVLPGGSELPYQGVTIDIFPSMDAVFAGDPHFIERFNKVHPDMDFGFAIQHFEKLRTQARIQLYQLDDIFVAH